MKIVILGPVASGKTTLAKELSEEIGIPFFQMDEIVHDDENQVKRDEQEQRKMINEIIHKNKEWIMEGMPRNHLEVLAANATSIIYLYKNKKELKRSLFLRTLANKLGIIKVKYKVDKNLYNRMKEYIENEDHSTLKELTKKYSSKLIIIKNKKELEVFKTALKEGEILKYQ